MTACLLWVSEGETCPTGLRREEHALGLRVVWVRLAINAHLVKG